MDGVACCTHGASRCDECIVSSQGPPRDKSRINECAGREGCIQQYLMQVVLEKCNMSFFTKRLHITLSLCPALRQTLVDFFKLSAKKWHFILITFQYFALRKYLVGTIQYLSLAFLFFPLKYLGMKYLTFKYILSRTALMCAILCVLAALEYRLSMANSDIAHLWLNYSLKPTPN